jgi:cholesterol oxidase
LVFVHAVRQADLLRVRHIAPGTVASDKRDGLPLVELQRAARRESVRATEADDVRQLGLSTRTANVLVGAGIETVGDLLRHADVSDLPGIGEQSVRDIVSALSASELEPRPAAREEPVTIEFTERMRGFISFGEEDFDRGYVSGKTSRTHLNLDLVIRIADVEGFMADGRHAGTVTGEVRCAALGGRLAVERGTLTVLAETGERGERRLTYRLFMHAEGDAITLLGFKVVAAEPGFEVWSDETTLFTRLYAGHVEYDGDDRAEIVAAGILHTPPTDLAAWTKTWRVHPAGRADVVERLAAFIGGDVWGRYRPGRRD